MFKLNILHIRADLGIKFVLMLHCSSLLRLSAPLESLIREKLSAKQPEAHDWFWSDQVPAVVTSFINKFEGKVCFTAAPSSYVSIFYFNIWRH